MGRLPRFVMVLVLVLMVVFARASAQRSQVIIGLDGISSSEAIAWGIQGRQIIFFRTHDRGRRWRRVRTSLSLDCDPSTAACNPSILATFSGKNMGWVAWVAPTSGKDAIAPSRTVAIARTSDFHHWTITRLSKTVLPVPYPANIAALQFVDGWHGMLEVAGPLGVGSAAKLLYKTNDGGRFWHLVRSNEVGVFPPHRGIPSYGQSVGLTFRRSNDAWLTASNPVGRTPQVFHSVDGCRQWWPLGPKLPVPAFVAGSSVDVWPSLGFMDASSRELTFALYFAGDPTRDAIYHRDTHGIWTVHLFPAALKSAAGIAWIVFANAADGWVASLGALEKTSDAGKTWQRLRSASWRAATEPYTSLGDLHDFRFVNATAGWALLTPRPDERGSALVGYTDNGGTKWIFTRLP